VASPESLSGFLDQARADVEEALARFLPAAPACPAIIGEAMRYSLFAGGKRFRPIRTLAAADAAARRDGRPVSIARALALPAASAVELIHTYSLVHDDLPAMDNDSLRRGRPTSHVVHGDGIAILAGDGLQAEAFALLAREPRIEGTPEIGAEQLAARKLRTIQVIGDAAGAAGMVGGQAIDLEAAGQAKSRRPEALDEAGLREMHARKTGALIRAAAVSGAVMAGASEEVIQGVDGYAAELGLAFQIVDDILDVEGSADELGKTAGKDAARAKPTYPALYGLDRSRALAAECIDRAGAALDAVGLQDGWLPAIGTWILHRSH
jgi:geranylgeranyl pyrophosphate synthase